MTWPTSGEIVSARQASGLGPDLSQASHAALSSAAAWARFLNPLPGVSSFSFQDSSPPPQT